MSDLDPKDPLAPDSDPLASSDNVATTEAKEGEGETETPLTSGVDDDSLVSDDGSDDSSSDDGKKKSSKKVAGGKSGKVDDGGKGSTASGNESGKTIKKRKPRSGFTNLNKPTFIENAKKRAKLAKKRGECMVKAAEILAVRTGAQVFLKAKYNAATKPYVFKFGKDFTMASEEEESVAAGAAATNAVDISEVNTAAVVQAVEEGFRGALETLDKTATPVQPAGSGHGSQDLFASPSAPSMAKPRRRISAAGCFVCGQDGDFIEVKGQKVPAEFFLCCRTGCRAKAHNECIGFPGAKYSSMVAVSPWYCQLHVGAGRVLPLDFDSVVELPGSAGGNPASDSAVGVDVVQPKKRGRPPKNDKAAASKPKK